MFACYERFIFLFFSVNCCVHKDVWSVTTEGLSCVGQDEVVFVLEVLPDEKYPPKDLFATVNTLYQEASKGNTRSKCDLVCFIYCAVTETTGCSV